MRIVLAEMVEGLPWPVDGDVAVMEGRTILGLPLEFGELEEWLRLEPRTIAGLVVEGDLDARFPITNMAPEGPFLWVRGSLKAPDIALNGSRLRVDGELECRGLTGPVEVLGDARCHLVFAAPRPIHVHGALAARLAVGKVFTDPSTAMVGWWNEEDMLLPDLLDDRGMPDPDRARAAIAGGFPLFRA